MTSNRFDKVIVHPLVLLSAVDHFNRMSKGGSQRRVVGVLLGCSRQNGKVLDISNSFAVPFDEESDVWFLDHEYLENMYGMFRKVNAREKIVGWYHTGPKLKPNDVAICTLMKQYNPDAVLVVINADREMPFSISAPETDELPFTEHNERTSQSASAYTGLPTDAYILVEEVHEDGTPVSKTFEHIPSEIGAEEAEEVGVEHLLRDIRNITTGSLSQRVMNQVSAVSGLKQSLNQMHQYLDNVLNNKLPVNQQILSDLQDIFNLLASPDDLITRATFSVTNDDMVSIYVATVFRTIIALHNLINNKIQNRNAEKNAAAAVATGKA